MAKKRSKKEFCNTKRKRKLFRNNAKAITDDARNDVEPATTTDCKITGCPPTYNRTPLDPYCAESREKLANYLICSVKGEDGKPCMQCFNASGTLAQHRDQLHRKIVYKCTRCLFQTCKSGSYQTHFMRNPLCDKKLHGARVDPKYFKKRLHNAWKVRDYCRLFVDVSPRNERQFRATTDNQDVCRNASSKLFETNDKDILLNENAMDVDGDESNVPENEDNIIESDGNQLKNTEGVKNTTQQEESAKCHSKPIEWEQSATQENVGTDEREQEIIRLHSRIRNLETQLGTSNADNEVFKNIIAVRDVKIRNMESELAQALENVQVKTAVLEEKENQNKELQHQLKLLQDKHTKYIDKYNEHCLLCQEPAEYEEKFKLLKKAVDESTRECSVLDLRHLVYNCHRYKNERNTLRGKLAKCQEVTGDERRGNKRRKTELEAEYDGLKLAINKAITTCNVKDLSQLVQHCHKYKKDLDIVNGTLAKYRQLPIDPSVPLTDDQKVVLAGLWHYINIMNKSHTGYSSMQKEIDHARILDGLPPLGDSSSVRVSEVCGNNWVHARSNDEKNYVLSLLHGYDSIPPTANRNDGAQRPAVIDGINIAHEYLKFLETQRLSTEEDREGYCGIMKTIYLLQEKMHLEDHSILIVMPFNHVYANYIEKKFTHEVIEVLFNRGMILAMPTINSVDGNYNYGGDYDDLAILMVARNTGGFIVSNDTFQEVWKENGLYSANKFKFVAKNRKLSIFFDNTGAISLLPPVNGQNTLTTITTFVFESNETDLNLLCIDED